MAAGTLLQCGDCGTLLKSVEVAQEHAEDTCHTNFRESSEALLYLVCTVCGKVSNCKTETGFHEKWTGHTEFQDKTAEVVEEQKRRAREKAEKEKEAHRKLEEALKAETRRQIEKLRTTLLEEKKISLPAKPATIEEQMKEGLRTIKQNHMVEEAKVKTAFNTLLTYVKNVATNPDEEKYRRIRLGNDKFQEKIGKVQGGIEFLELCGFEKIEEGQFLYMPKEKVDMAVLHSAGHELNNAIKTPFFDVL